MDTIDEQKNENNILKGSVLILIIIALIAWYQKCMLKENGIITVCKVNNYEATASGGDLHITIYYKGKEYNSVAGAICSGCKDKYFFVKIMENKPTGVVIFLEDNPVPECILQKAFPPNGWKSIPECK